jgi:predicted CXXCH cytochrome family protein
MEEQNTPTPNNTDTQTAPSHRLIAPPPRLTARPAARIWAAAILVSAAALAVAQHQSVLNSPHNLSASGPGSIRASSEDEVCIFCHAPHNASSVQPLWNRSMPTGPYNVYSSSSLISEPGQPTGSSKMCLSCHDGTIAIGSVVSRNQVIHMSGGITTLPPGRTNLGTDLSDDHPISFRYDSSLATKNPKLADPGTIPAALRLDPNHELQCTTCHNPHNNIHGSFLAMSNENSAMCRSCHQHGSESGPRISGHDDCASCHQPHTAPSGPFLLRGDRISATCIGCHDGSRSSAANIAAELKRISTHDTFSPINSPAIAAPGELHAHATCADCHDPHTMRPAISGRTGPEISPTFGSIRGISASGAMLTAATREDEVCYRCHGDNSVSKSPSISRQASSTNMRLMFSTSALSAHPVQAPGTGNVPSLRAPWSSGSILACTDCHGSDTSRKAGGSGPDGLHGSNQRPLLLARYETANFTMESPSAYALCYRCHDRDGPDGILQDRSFTYHRLHIVDQRTPCSACHDSHGIAGGKGSTLNHARLMNFDLSIVSPDPLSGRLEFRKEGTFSGSCYLSCHGVNHSPKSY